MQNTILTRKRFFDLCIAFPGYISRKLTRKNQPLIIVRVPSVLYLCDVSSNNEDLKKRRKYEEHHGLHS